MIHNSRLRVLLAVVYLRRYRLPITVRMVAAQMGWHNTYWVHRCLKRLRTDGLIAYDGKLAATIKPLCTVELIPNEPENEE